MISMHCRQLKTNLKGIKSIQQNKRFSFYQTRFGYYKYCKRQSSIWGIYISDRYSNLFDHANYPRSNYISIRILLLLSFSMQYKIYICVNIIFLYMSLLVFWKWKTCYKSGKLHMVSRMRKHPQPQTTKDSLDGRIISFMCFSFNFSRFPPSQDCIKPKHIFSHSCKLLILKFSIFFGRLI